MEVFKRRLMLFWHTPEANTFKIRRLLPAAEIVCVFFRPIVQAPTSLLTGMAGGQSVQRGFLNLLGIAQIWIHIQSDGTFQLKAYSVIIL
jgi:hypothetical protein